MRRVNVMHGGDMSAARDRRLFPSPPPLLAPPLEKCLSTECRGQLLRRFCELRDRGEPLDLCPGQKCATQILPSAVAEDSKRFLEIYSNRGCFLVRSRRPEIGFLSAETTIFRQAGGLIFRKRPERKPASRLGRAG